MKEPRTSYPPNNYADLISLTLHRAVADHLRQSPQLIRKAKSNLNIWLKRNPNERAWLEWKKMLETENLESIIKIISAETDEGQRLRSSSPFVGIISKEARQEILKICEKAGSV